MADDDTSGYRVANDTFSASTRQSRTALLLSAVMLLIFSYFAEPLNCGMMKIGFQGNGVTVSDNVVHGFLNILVFYFLISFWISSSYDNVKPGIPTKVTRLASELGGGYREIVHDLKGTFSSLAEDIKVFKQEREAGALIRKQGGEATTYDDHSLLEDLKTLERLISQHEGITDAEKKNQRALIERCMASISGIRSIDLELSVQSQFLLESDGIEDRVEGLSVHLLNAADKVNRYASEVKKIGFVKVNVLDLYGPMVFGGLVLFSSALQLE